ncbi:uncharacterized protein LOC133814903 [Humulus lupulus]|uniref:uncharacterized protein LOC133814903 n=1 Tax=Humulus lupulus TaxID=3486 RepID=UPI002B400C2F|nr:uncharacterized protein LOC133814903 [Humulus lupulus]
MASDKERSIRFNELNTGIVRPEIQAPQFKLKPVMFQMLETVGQFKPSSILEEPNELRKIPQGTLPSDTENPGRDGKDHCKAVTLRSGKNLELNEDNPKSKSKPTSIQSNVEKEERVVSSKMSNVDPEAIFVAIPQQNAIEKPMRAPPPFPQRFQKQQQDSQFQRFLDVLKQLHISIPLVEALEQMPNYVKFLKDILTKKRRLGEFEMISLTEGCSAILKNKISPKLKDPGSFTIPISIGGREVDFIILYYEDDRDVPIILGRPFLATKRTLIDVEKGELIIRAQDEQDTFKVFNPIRSPNEVESCLAISASNFKLIENMHEKLRNGVKKKIPFEEIEKGGEPWISKEEAPSHPPKLPKKKKHSRKLQSQMLEVGNKVFFSNSLVKSRCDGGFLVSKVFPNGVVDLYDEHLGRAFKVLRKQADGVLEVIFGCDCFANFLLQQSGSKMVDFVGWWGLVVCDLNLFLLGQQLDVLSRL